MKFTLCAFQKNTDYNFPSRLLRFRMLWCTFTRFNPLFVAFTWFWRIVVDPCFIHRHKSMQKLFRIVIKISQIMLQGGHTNAFLVDCEQSRQNIDHTLSWDVYNLSYLTHFHLRVIQNNIMNLIYHFWCSDLIGMTWSWYGFCARATTTKFGKPLLNHSLWGTRARIMFIELGLGFW